MQLQRRNLYHSSVQNYVETFFFAKKKVKDPMLDGFLNNFTKTFSIPREFLRSAGENNAHCNFNCMLKIILQLF